MVDPLTGKVIHPWADYILHLPLSRSVWKIRNSHLLIHSSMYLLTHYSPSTDSDRTILGVVVSTRKSTEKTKIGETDNKHTKLCKIHTISEAVVQQRKRKLEKTVGSSRWNTGSHFSGGIRELVSHQWLGQAKVGGTQTPEMWVFQVTDSEMNAKLVVREAGQGSRSRGMGKWRGRFERQPGARSGRSFSSLEGHRLSL